MLKQFLIDRTRARFDHVVRMDDKAHEAGLARDNLCLFFPDTSGKVTKNIEQRIVLNCGHWDFENVTNKVGHDGAAATALRIQVRNVGNRHIVGKFKLVVPHLFSIENCATKSFRVVLLAVCIDLRGSLYKLLLTLVEVAVMVKVMNDQLMLALSDRVEEFRTTL